MCVENYRDIIVVDAPQMCVDKFRDTIIANEYLPIFPSPTFRHVTVQSQTVAIYLNIFLKIYNEKL